MDFPKFDPSLGTLTVVGVKLEGNIAGTLFYENTSISDEVLVPATVSTLFFLIDPIATVVPELLLSATLPPFDGVLDFGGPSGRTFIFNETKMNSVSTTSPSHIASFTGTGLITLPVFTHNGECCPLFPNPGSVIGGFEWIASGNVTVTYTYDAIPEPSAALLTLPVLAGMLYFRRRR